jgi:hypothetical protein
MVFVTQVMRRELVFQAVIIAGPLNPSFFKRDFAIGYIALGVTTNLDIFVPRRSRAVLRIICLIVFETQLTAVLKDGFLVSCHNSLSPSFWFNRRSRPGRKLVAFESVTLLVDDLYDEAIEAVMSRAALLSSTPGVYSLGGGNP